MKYWAWALLLFCSAAGVVDKSRRPGLSGAFYRRMQLDRQRIDRAQTTALDHEPNIA